MDAETEPSIEAERGRILAENRRRESGSGAVRYAPWNPVEQFLVHQRKQVAAALLSRADRIPGPATRCLEVGFGRGGWLADLIAWGAPESNLFGVEIDPRRVLAVKRRLPAARLVVADARRLPWPERSFDLVILSLVLTSVLDPAARRRIASEVERVMASDGALLWYDFAVDSPGNPQVRGVDSAELRSLFPQLSGRIRSTTLVPPLARLIVPRSRWLAELLACLPFLRTHLLAVLNKPPADC